MFLHTYGFIKIKIKIINNIVQFYGGENTGYAVMKRPIGFKWERWLKQYRYFVIKNNDPNINSRYKTIIQSQIMFP